MTFDLANWLSSTGGSKLISELSIPGTHDSASLPTQVFPTSGRLRLSTQTRGLRAQLEGGSRFLDLRCGNIRNASGVYEFALYHESNKTGTTFTEARDICQAFLKEHVGETIIVSVKEEEKASRTGLNFEKTFDRYVGESPGLWFLENRIPRLAEVRGKLVLFRRFIIADPKDKPKGINAYNGFPNNETKTIIGPPRLEIQDDYGIKSDDILHKWTVIQAHLAKALKPESLRDWLFVNFTSAAGILKRDYPLNAASFINPKVGDYFSTALHGRLGILPRDFESIDFRPAGTSEAVDQTARFIIQTNGDYFYVGNKRDSPDGIDFQGGADGTPLIAHVARPNPIYGGQLLQFIRSDTPPYFYIVNRLTGTVVGLAPEGAPSGTRRLVAATRATPEMDSQLWSLAPAQPQGYFYITSKVADAGVITISGPRNLNGSPLIAAARQTPEATYQVWTLSPQH